MRGRPGRVTKNGMAEPLQQEPLQEPTRPWPRVYLDGYFTAMRSVFFYVLVGNYVGLGALAFEFGFGFWWMAASTLLIWAAPAQVILISTLTTATLVEVGLGRWSAHDVKVALEAKDRARCGPVAPSAGLYLSGVRYD